MMRKLAVVFTFLAAVFTLPAYSAVAEEITAEDFKRGNHLGWVLG